ncbi:MAG: hypothetical protein AAGC99_03190, partial [Pseudomonadota bacterium]
PQDAVSKTRNALALARKRGEPGHEAYGLRILGDISMSLGDTKGAMVAYQGTKALTDTHGLRPLAALTELRIGRLLDWTGRKVDAQQHIDSAERLAADLGMTLWEMPTRSAKG